MTANKETNVLSPVETLVDGATTSRPGDSSKPKYSALRKFALLLVFCLSQFLDVFNNSALFSAIPTIAGELGMTGGEPVWIVSATQLTFAAFLLLSGRISDVYSAKYAFISGTAALGFLNLGIGFVRNKIALFILRAISGIFASLTIPSALNLIVKLFPEPLEQSRAIAVFGAVGAIANIIGLLIGAVLVQYASWPWVFYFTTIIALPVAVAGTVLIPAQDELDSDAQANPDEPKAAKMHGLDVLGVSLLTIAFILLIFALTEGSAAGWATAKVLVPLIISVFLVAGFLYYETLIPEEKAAIPPKTWFYPNFSVLFGTALMPFMWWTSVFLIFTTYWQDILHMSVISTAVHMLPIGIAAIAMTPTGSLSRVVDPKWLILGGEALTIVATILLPFAGKESRYWSIVFPAFTLGSAGVMLTYTHTNIAIFRSTPPSMSGTVGAIFNAALQLGSAVGSAIVTSISTTVDDHSGSAGHSSFDGRAASFWFLLGVVLLETLSLIVFYRRDRPRVSTPETGSVTTDESVEQVKVTVAMSGNEEKV